MVPALTTRSNSKLPFWLTGDMTPALSARRASKRGWEGVSSFIGDGRMEMGLVGVWRLVVVIVAAMFGCAASPGGQWYRYGIRCCGRGVQRVLASSGPMFGGCSAILGGCYTTAGYASGRGHACASRAWPSVAAMDSSLGNRRRRRTTAICRTCEHIASGGSARKAVDASMQQHRLVPALDQR